MPGWLACACTHVTPLFLNTYKRTTNCLLLFYNTLIYHNLCIQLFHTRAHIFPFSTRQTPQLDRKKTGFRFRFFRFFFGFFVLKKNEPKTGSVSRFRFFLFFRFGFFLHSQKHRFGSVSVLKPVFFRFGSVLTGYE